MRKAKSIRLSLREKVNLLLLLACMICLLQLVQTMLLIWFIRLVWSGLIAVAFNTITQIP